MVRVHLLQSGTKLEVIAAATGFADAKTKDAEEKDKADSAAALEKQIAQLQKQLTQAREQQGGRRAGLYSSPTRPRRRLTSPRCTLRCTRRRCEA